jgi:hypothetical protein
MRFSTSGFFIKLPHPGLCYVILDKAFLNIDSNSPRYTNLKSPITSGTKHFNLELS